MIAIRKTAILTRVAVFVHTFVHNNKVTSTQNKNTFFWRNLMLAQIKNTLLVASAHPQFKVAIQIIILALLLIAALVQPEAALANPSWGNVGG